MPAAGTVGAEEEPFCSICQDRPAWVAPPHEHDPASFLISCKMGSAVECRLAGTLRESAYPKQLGDTEQVQDLVSALLQACLAGPSRCFRQNVATSSVQDACRDLSRRRSFVCGRCNLSKIFRNSL